MTSTLEKTEAVRGKGVWRQRSWLIVRSLAVGVTAYVLGAAVMYFGLPTSHFLGDAFNGGRAWFEQRQLARQSRK